MNQSIHYHVSSVSVVVSNVPEGPSLFGLPVYLTTANCRSTKYQFLINLNAFHWLAKEASKEDRGGGTWPVLRRPAAAGNNLLLRISSRTRWAADVDECTLFFRNNIQIIMHYIIVRWHCIVQQQTRIYGLLNGHSYLNQTIIPAAPWLSHINVLGPSLLQSWPEARPNLRYDLCTK